MPTYKCIMLTQRPYCPLDSVNARVDTALLAPWLTLNQHKICACHRLPSRAKHSRRCHAQRNSTMSMSAPPVADCGARASEAARCVATVRSGCLCGAAGAAPGGARRRPSYVTTLVRALCRDTWSGCRCRRCPADPAGPVT